MGKLFKDALVTKGRDTNTEYDGFAVTPADATALGNGPCQALYITGTGNVAGTLSDGTTTFVLTGVPANTLVPISVSIVASTNTTATGISALYKKGA